MGISFQHLLILAIILLILGPKRLPELAHMLGKAYRNFKDIMDGVNEAKFRKIADDLVTPSEEKTPPPKNTAPRTDSPQIPVIVQDEDHSPSDGEKKS